jgi:hypothetical protein
VRLALVAALLVACGDSHVVADAGGDGGGGDGAMADADPNVRGAVTVHVVDKNDAPLAGMYVVFIDRDGTLAETITDAAGTAQADVYPSASVTVVRTRGMSYALATVLELVPGDDITLISAGPDVPSSEDPFSSRLVPLPSADIAPKPDGAVQAGSVATFTTLAPHGLAAGDHVIVSSVGVAGYNGSWTVASVPSPTTFTADLGTSGLSASGTGAIGATATKALAITVGFTAYGGADHYEVHTRCGSVDVGTSTSPAVYLPVGCAASPTDIEVLARTSAGALLAWTAQADVAVADGGSVTIADTWHAPASVTATYTNPTPRVTNIAAARFSADGRGLAIAETSGSASATTMLSLDASRPPRAVIASLFTCPFGASASCLDTEQGAASQRITERVDGTAASYALDIGASLLPWVEASYVPQTTTLEVEVTGSAPIDLFEANLRYTRGQAIYTWRVFGPIAESVTFPSLPPNAPGDPTIRTSDVMSTYQAFAGESDAIAGYRAAIANPFESLATCNALAVDRTRPVGGTKNRISQWN